MTTPDPDGTLAKLLALGVPYSLAVEAIASTALDRDEDDGGAHTRRFPRHLTPDDQRVVADELEAMGYEVTEPAWLREDPDGFRIVDRD